MAEENPKFPFTVENWPIRYSQLGNLPSHLLGFEDAVKWNIKALTLIVETNMTFDELKAELLTYIQHSQEMVDDIDLKWDSDDPEKYGLPVSSTTYDGHPRHQKPDQM